MANSVLVKVNPLAPRVGITFRRRSVLDMAPGKLDFTSASKEVTAREDKDGDDGGRDGAAAELNCC